MEQAKTMFEHDLVDNFAFSKDHQIFKYINSITSHHSIPASVHFGNTTAYSDFHKASLFNEFFHTTFTSSYRPLNQPTVSVPPNVNTLSDVVISPIEVYEALTTLDPTKAKGIDSISPITLSRCALALYEPIHYLFFRWINQCNIPSEWRIHLISPIFKSGDKQSVTNYRPIPLLYILSNVLELLIYKQNHWLCHLIHQPCPIWLPSITINYPTTTPLLRPPPFFPQWKLQTGALYLL